MADEYSERKLEQQRVDWTIQQIDAQIKKTQAALDSAHQETRAVEKNFGENASINRYEVDDIAESRSELEQQRQLVARTVENETILRHQLQTLQQLRESPYFGRIDILDPGEKEPESLYIGTASLMNDDKTDFIVYDWRAPISGIYYNGTLGKVQYQTPAGTQSTTLVKKRQFTIKDGQIINMFDTNETVGDQMLQEALGHQNDQYMQNIVATIQKLFVIPKAICCWFKGWPDPVRLRPFCSESPICFIIAEPHSMPIRSSCSVPTFCSAIISLTCCPAWVSATCVR